MEQLRKKNYETVYSEGNPENENWCLSCKFNKVTEVTIRLNDGKQYQYLSRFPADVGDVAIIGNQFPAMNDYEYGPVATTGQFGTVSGKKDKVEMKKGHAAELDFVFHNTADKQLIKQCSAYLSLDDYFKTMQHEKHFSPIRPITYFIRAILAACSILANQSLADKAAIDKAQLTLHMLPALDENKVSELWYGMWGVGIDLDQVFVSGIENAKDLPVIEDKAYLREKAMLGDLDTRGVKFIGNSGIKEYIAKYTYIGAVSIMVRGGFVNLLKAFVQQNPPAKEYLVQVKDLICAVGNAEAIGIVEDYLK